MAEIDIKDKSNAVVGKMSLPDKLFGLKVNDALLHAAVVNHLANQRQGTHATKTKGLVRGGGKKPHKQKSTGRARAGSNRSPIWKGGGTVFGPQPRDYSYSMPKQARRAALYGALSRKLSDGEAVVLESLSVESPKTKEMAGIIGSLQLTGKSILIVLAKRDDNVRLAARNIPAVSVRMVSDINAHDVLKHQMLLFTRDAVEMVGVRE
ncbi:MAG: 50S ribosomal protein L4 [Thermodesulfovibrionales bacterium]|nr:50S ribosomal protein L4 [Thermodesulfovibrionales bacterium]